MYTTGEYLSNNPTWHTEDSPWKAAKIFEILTENQIFPKTIAEIGCGAGEILVQLARLRSDQAQYVGYEISPQAFAMTVERATPNIRFVNGDFFASNGHADVALVIDVIEHLENYFTFLRALKERATYKVFHIPLELSAQTVLRERPLLEGRRSVGHIHYFTRGIALAALEELGYQIIDARYTKGGIELPKTHWKTRLARPFREWLFRVSPDLAARALAGFSLLVLAR